MGREGRKGKARKVSDLDDELRVTRLRAATVRGDPRSEPQPLDPPLRSLYNQNALVDSLQPWGTAPLVSLESRMLSMMAILAFGSLVQAPESIRSSEVRGADPVTLARRLLPSDSADRIVDGRVHRAWQPSETYDIGLWERPAVHATGLCKRTVHFGQVMAPGATPPPQPDAVLEVLAFTTTVQYSPTYPREATNETCQVAEAWIASTDTNLEPTLRMLNRLTEAMKEAAGRDRLSFEVSCTSEVQADCTNARSALSNLPLDKILGIRLRNTEYRNDPVQNGVRVRYMQPVADGRWPEAEVSFNNSDPDGRSWTVVLKGIDRLEGVEMRRTTIIRH